MIFATGGGEAITIWTLVDFDTDSHYARYSRVTPATRAAVIDVRCTASERHATDVEVTYAVTALTREGMNSLDAYRGQSFVDMIEAWKQKSMPGLPLC